MTAGDDAEFRALTASDAIAMRSFSCRDFKAPWTEVIQDMIQGPLADLVAAGHDGTYGLLSDGVLLAVGAWTLDDSAPPVCRSEVIAVSNVGRRRKGYGRRLKGEEINAARAAGAGSVVSQVHWGNEIMALPARVQQALDVVRVVGNNAVHPGQIDFDDEDNADVAAALFDLTNLIVDKMITEPRTVEELYARLPQGALEAIVRRDQAPDSSS